MATETKHIVIVGGGTAGITVAASLMRKSGGNGIAISIIEPSENHYYQPAFTLVGAGAYKLNDTKRATAKVMPKGVEWVKDKVTGFEPEQNRVKLGSGTTMNYDYLIVCPGLELNWEKVPGTRDSLGRNGVCSNYSPDFAESTWDNIQHLKPGQKALFTQPPLPFKCPGAPQKAAYLCADYLKKHGINGVEIHFMTHGPAMFAVPLFAKELVKVAANHGIKVHFQTNLVSVDSAKKEATFEYVGGEKQGQKMTMAFDMIHVTPPQTPMAALRASPLANQAGFTDLNQNTMQHVKFPNVFGLGDAGSTPNSKTAAAVRKQSPVLVKNLLTLLRGGSLEPGYDGYASCPLTTAYGKCIMAEFIYGGKVTPTFPLDPRKERWFNWWIKATGLPIFYWNYMLKGHEWFLPHDTKYVEPPQVA
jgi:sulfide:quinone oxidoreductase